MKNAPTIKLDFKPKLLLIFSVITFITGTLDKILFIFILSFDLIDAIIMNSIIELLLAFYTFILGFCGILIVYSSKGVLCLLVAFQTGSLILLCFYIYRGVYLLSFAHELVEVTSILSFIFSFLAASNIAVAMLFCLGYKKYKQISPESQSAGQTVNGERFAFNHNYPNEIQPDNSSLRSGVQIMSNSHMKGDSKNEVLEMHQAAIRTEGLREDV